MERLNRYAMHLDAGYVSTFVKYNRHHPVQKR